MLPTSLLNQPEPETTANGYQLISVCAPVRVTPHAQTGEVITQLCGDPVVQAGRINNPNGPGFCVFTICQDLCITVPVEFSAEATVERVQVECGDASATDLCDDCTSTDD